MNRTRAHFAKRPIAWRGKDAVSVVLALLPLGGCAEIWGFEDAETAVTSGGGLGGSGAFGASGGVGGSGATTTTSPGGAGGAGTCLCTPGCQWGEFGSLVEVVAVNSTASEADPQPSADGLDLYFASLRDPVASSTDWNLFQAHRDDALGAFGSPTELSGLRTDQADNGPFVSADGLRLYFASSRTGTVGSYDLWMSTRNATSEAFSSVTSLDELNLAGEDVDPVVSGDELTIYFVSVRDGAPSRDIYRAPIEANGASFGAATLLGGVNSDEPEFDPTLSADELEIFFTRTSNDQRDIFRSWRSSVDADFGPAVRVDTLSVEGSDDHGPALSADGTTIYFATDRDHAGDWDIWQATRSCASP